MTKASIYLGYSSDWHSGPPDYAEYQGYVNLDITIYDDDYKANLANPERAAKEIVTALFDLADVRDPEEVPGLRAAILAEIRQRVCAELASFATGVGVL